MTADSEMPERMSEYCNRYVDDAPGVRGDCARHLSDKLPCTECPNRNTYKEVRDLRSRLARTEAALKVARELMRDIQGDPHSNLTLGMSHRIVELLAQIATLGGKP